MRDNHIANISQSFHELRNKNEDLEENLRLLKHHTANGIKSSIMLRWIIAKLKRDSTRDCPNGNQTTKAEN